MELLVIKGILLFWGSILGGSLRFINLKEEGDVSVGSVDFGPLELADLACGFETGLCAWLPGAFNSSQLSTEATDAPDAHTKTGIFRATSNASENRTSMLESSFKATEKPMALAFAYKLTGSDDALEVQSQTINASWASLWLGGGGQATWQEAVVAVPTGSTALRLLATTAANELIHLDSVLALNVATAPENISCQNFSADLCEWVIESEEPASLPHNHVFILQTLNPKP